MTVRPYQVVLACATIAIAISGCGGSRCRAVGHARADLSHARTARTADVRVVVPYARANAVIADALRDRPLVVPVESPGWASLLPGVPDIALETTVTELALRPTRTPGRVRFALHLRVTDTTAGSGDDARIGDLDAVIEVLPSVKRTTTTELVFGIDPQALVRAKPSLGPDTETRLRAAIEHRIPAALRGKLPSGATATAARRLAGHLLGRAWDLVRTRLGPRIGDVTTLRLRLPAVPIANLAVASTPNAVVVDIESSLPVRRGLAPRSVGASPDDVEVTISGSAAAELANWAIDRGYAPTWYTRDLKPSSTGEFHPRFDYLAGDGHPIKVYSFQDRGGCSFFRVGVEARVALDRDRLEVTAIDRDLEASAANPVIAAGAWAKFFLFGWVDQSKRVAATTRLTIGKRVLETRVVSAALANDELRFALHTGWAAAQLPR